MPRELLITLALPPAACSPNSRADWHERHRATQAFRTDAGWTAREALAGGEPFSACALAIRYVLCGKTPKAQYAPKDCDNGLAAVKAAQDGLRDAGVFSNDLHRQIRRVCCEIDRHAPHRKGVACPGSRVEITVIEAE